MEQKAAAGREREAALMGALDELFRASVELVASLPSLQGKQIVERALTAIKDGRLEEADAALVALEGLLAELTLSESAGGVQRRVSGARKAISEQRSSEAEEPLRRVAAAVQIPPAEAAAVESPLFVEAARKAVWLKAEEVAAANLAQVEKRLQDLGKEWGLAETAPKQQGTS